MTEANHNCPCQSNPQKGKLIIFSAPSGSGKSTIVQWLMHEHPELNLHFLEYEEVYANRFYGTLKSQVEQQLAAGQNVVFDVDVKGGCNIKQFYGSQALSLFVQPPSIAELRKRLEGRATDAPEVIEQRLQKAQYELTFAPRFDTIIVNDDLETAKRQTYQCLKTFLSR